MEFECPLLVEAAQGFELQGHGMGAGLGGVFVSQAVVVMVLHGVSVLVLGKRPEAVQVDLVTEASGQRVHQQTGRRAFYQNLVCQPVPDRVKKIIIIMIQ